MTAKETLGAVQSALAAALAWLALVFAKAGAFAHRHNLTRTALFINFLAGDASYCANAAAKQTTLEGA